MIRNLLTLILLSAVAMMAKAGQQYTAAVYDNDGNFLNIMTVEVNATPQGVTIAVPGSDLKGTMEFAMPMNQGDGFLWLQGGSDKAGYMIIDDGDCSIRFSDSKPESLSDFKYALSFDPKDWANLRFVLK